MPITEAQKMLEADIEHQFDVLEEARSLRLDSATSELPTPLWTLVLVGALICIALTWFFNMESLNIHLWMTIFIPRFLD